MSKRKKKKTVKKAVRYVIALLLYPFVLIVVPIYKLYKLMTTYKNPKIKYEDIVTGFSYLVVKDSAVEQLAKRRAEICSKCPLAQYNGKLNTIIANNEVYEIKGMYCSACGCALSAKVRAENEHCPKGKW